MSVQGVRQGVHARVPFELADEPTVAFLKKFPFRHVLQNEGDLFCLRAVERVGKTAPSSKKGCLSGDPFSRSCDASHLFEEKARSPGEVAIFAAEKFVKMGKEGGAPESVLQEG